MRTLGKFVLFLCIAAYICVPLSTIQGKEEYGVLAFVFAVTAAFLHLGGKLYHRHRALPKKCMHCRGSGMILIQQTQYYCTCPLGIAIHDSMNIIATCSTSNRVSTVH